MFRSSVVNRIAQNVVEALVGNQPDEVDLLGPIDLFNGQTDCPAIAGGCCLFNDAPIRHSRSRLRTPAKILPRTLGNQEGRCLGGSLATA